MTNKNGHNSSHRVPSEHFIILQYYLFYLKDAIIAVLRIQIKRQFVADMNDILKMLEMFV